MGNLAQDGFMILPFHPAVAEWAAAAHPLACDATADPSLQARWLRHGGTWFVGLDVLPNLPDGSIGGAPLAGGWTDQVKMPAAWHRAQVSVVHPGYPGRDAGESDAGDSDAAHRYRLVRDAGHLDGLLGIGPAKRRFLREPHAFILGIGLNTVGAGASPLVVWEGSHRLIGSAFAAAFAGIPPQDWAETDVTAAYQAVRAEIFATCPRRTLSPGLGEAVLVHRRALHGVAPWTPGAKAPPEGRMIAYFRPLFALPADWLKSD